MERFNTSSIIQIYLQVTISLVLILIILINVLIIYFHVVEKCGRYHDYKCPKHDFYRIGRLMRNRDSDKIKRIYINITFKL